MSQPRRRRRRGRRRPDKASEPTKREAVESSRQGRDEQPTAQRSSRGSRRSRGRRGRTRARETRSSSPKSSEDLVRGDPKRPPTQLTAPHDGTSLEQVIGELQSTWGVPQHPQEYRITLKVAEERGDRATVVEEKTDATESTEIPPGGEEARPRREKAPAAPRITSSAADAEGSTPAMTERKKRPRRRRRRPKGAGGAT
jgi:hypothetical protein